MEIYVDFVAEQDKAAADAKKMEEKRRSDQQKAEFKKIKGKFDGYAVYKLMLIAMQTKTKLRRRRRKKSARLRNEKKRPESLRICARAAT